MKKSALVAALSLFVSSCMVGPNYKRPKVALPSEFRGAAAAVASNASLADT
ncbi:MAG: RND transporter, partial [Bryobacteraceae bacterium]|nr:RND transporter [Bryobacteraceae bacterium]